ncbi:hypothetical protein GPU89_12085 [Burkholderia cepacia]|nr:hypothetical protein [Burkholderia cepacia]
MPGLSPHDAGFAEAHQEPLALRQCIGRALPAEGKSAFTLIALAHTQLLDDEHRAGEYMKLEDRIALSIKRRKSVVVLRSEVAPLGSASHVGRVLAKMVSDGRLIRVNQGVYCKTRVNRFTNALAPAAPFEMVAAEVVKKLNIQVRPGQLAREYNSGTTSSKISKSSATTRIRIFPLQSPSEASVERKFTKDDCLGRIRDIETTSNALSQ